MKKVTPGLKEQIKAASTLTEAQQLARKGRDKFHYAKDKTRRAWGRALREKQKELSV